MKMSTKKSTSSDNKANSLDVLEWIKKRKLVSTNEIAAHFGIRPMQAAANVAILRIKNAVEPAQIPERSNDQSSRWSYASG